jgi:phage/plasmid primase-like uncharacterized protein
VTDRFRQAMERADIVTKDRLVPDGRLHRVHVEGDKERSKNGWYVLNTNPYPCAVFGTWKDSDVTHTWRLPPKKRLKREAREALEQQAEEVARAQAAEIVQRQQKMAKVARRLWERAQPASDEHPYLKKKHARASGARLLAGRLVVSVWSMDDKLCSLQFIDADGEKLFLRGGRVKGCGFGIGEPQGRMYVCEGFATGAAIHEATGQAVVVAFNAGNLKAVAVELAKKYPKVELIVAGDDDQYTKGNPGRARAVEAAQAAQCRLVLPRFSDISTQPTDFDDLFVLQGAEETRKALEPTALAGLLDALMVFVRRFVIMTEAQARAVALWIIHTYAILGADATPYLDVSSPEMRSGKTRLLEILQLLVALAWYTGRVTAAVLTRKIDAEAPALLLDESDTAFSGNKEYAEALRGVLDMGHHRGGKTSCCIGQGADITYKDFSVFCPKALAGIKRLPGTVGDRTIPIRLKRAKRGEKKERFRVRKVKPQAERLTVELQTWATPVVIQVLSEAEPTLPEELNDRQQDGAEPLLAIADLAGGQWPEAARSALIELCAQADADEDSVGVMLLADIRSVFYPRNADGEPLSKLDRIASENLVKKLVSMLDRPWPAYGKLQKPITQAKIADLLDQYEDGKGHPIKPRSLRFPKTGVRRGYEHDWFVDAWQRYLPSDP